MAVYYQRKIREKIGAHTFLRQTDSKAAWDMEDSLSERAGEEKTCHDHK